MRVSRFKNRTSTESVAHRGRSVSYKELGMGQCRIPE